MLRTTILELPTLRFFATLQNDNNYVTCLSSIIIAFLKERGQILEVMLKRRCPRVLSIQGIASGD
jgi:hypothetical protein